jgi:glycosidase
MKTKFGLLITIFFFFFCNCFAQNNHPSWSYQSNIYEVNLRQYSQSGSIKDFEKHLARLKNMGVDILWFMPITPIGIEGRKMNENELGSYYAVKNYKEVSPEFGTMADWKALVKHAHSMGFKVITDWVPNHSSPDNPWVKRHPDFYARDKDGNMVIPFDWTDTRKLNYDNKELRDSMTDAMKFWIKESDIDGFRCDVAEGPPADFWKECISSLRKIKNIFMLAEGEKPELHTAGFDATYTWSTMSAVADVCSAKSSLSHLDSVINKNIQTYPKNSFRMFFTTNHDWNSWEGTEFEKFGNAYKTVAVFTQTMYQSIPLIYSGQEVLNKKRLKFFVKDTIAWNYNPEITSFYKTLLTLRKTNAALAADASYKKIVTANDVAIFAYTKQKQGHKVAVILNLSNQPQSFTIKDNSISGMPLNVFLKKKELLNRTHVFEVAPWDFILYDYK